MMEESKTRFSIRLERYGKNANNPKLSLPISFEKTYALIKPACKFKLIEQSNDIQTTNKDILKLRLKHC